MKYMNERQRRVLFFLRERGGRAKLGDIATRYSRFTAEERRKMLDRMVQAGVVERAAQWPPPPKGPTATMLCLTASGREYLDELDAEVQWGEGG